MARQAASRPVPLWRLFLRMGGWISFIFAAGSIAITLIANLQTTLADRFDAEAVETVATVADKYTETSTDSDGDTTVSYYFDMAFDTRTGARMRVSHSFSRARYNATGIGDTLPLWYLPSEPDRFEMERGAYRSSAGIAQVIGLVNGVIFLVLFWFPARWAVEAVRARRYGERMQAKVTRHHRTGVRINNKPRYRLVWQGADGREGKSMLHAYDTLQAHPVGSTVAVYQGLKRSWWEGDTGAREAP